MNIYYALWSDVINHERIKNGGEDYWKTFTFCSMSLMLSFNLMAFYSAILFLTGYNIASEIKQYLMFFQSDKLNNFLWAIVALFIPSMIIVYFSVFYKKKYEYILSRYKFRQGKLLIIYCILSAILVFVFGLLSNVSNSG